MIENNNTKTTENNQEIGNEQERRQVQCSDFAKPTNLHTGQGFQQSKQSKEEEKNKQLEESQSRKQFRQEVVVIDSQEEVEEQKQQNINPDNQQNQQEDQNIAGELFDQQAWGKSPGKQEKRDTEKGQESLKKKKSFEEDRDYGCERYENNEVKVKVKEEEEEEEEEEEQKSREFSNQVETLQEKDHSSKEPLLEFKHSLELNTIMDKKNSGCSWSFFEDDTDQRKDSEYEEQQNLFQFNESCLDSEEDNSDCDYDERVITELPKKQMLPEDSYKLRNQGEEEGQDENSDDDCQILSANETLAKIFDQARHKGIKRRDIQDSLEENILNKNIAISSEQQEQHVQSQIFPIKQIKLEQNTSQKYSVKHEILEQSRSYPQSELPIFSTSTQQSILINQENQEKRQEYWNKKKQYFVCATGSNLKNCNLIITQELDKLLKIYQQEKDIGRSIAYRKALSILRTLPFEITSKQQIQNIQGIGTKIKGKIAEIIKTGNCQKAQALSTDERNKVIEMLSAVWGIGPSTAASLYQDGIRSIQQLREKKEMLNRNQQIGLRYYEEILQKMPRDEATEIVEKVKQALKDQYSPEDFSKLEVTACGSYRRGKETCGDVDILLSWKDGQETKPKGLMQNLLKQLTDQDFLTENLSMPHVNSYGLEQYMGLCKIRTLHRRIDIKYYPIELYGYALLYFTGSDYFNRSMRLFARKKGYSLSDHGLFRVTRLAKNNKITSPFSIKCYNEQAVFAALELEYKTPEQRNV